MPVSHIVVFPMGIKKEFSISGSCIRWGVMCIYIKTTANPYPSSQIEAPQGLGPGVRLISDTVHRTWHIAQSIWEHIFHT